MVVTTLIRTCTVLATLVLAGCVFTRVDEGPWPNVPRSFTAPMNAARAVPPNNSQATGLVYATLSTEGVLRWNVAYQGLTGYATSAYFYGPAGPGANAVPLVNIGVLGVAPQMRGEAKLTDAQIVDLVNGRWYASVQTHANPSGEIRGQMVFQP
jgi:CHRD domain